MLPPCAVLLPLPWLTEDPDELPVLVADVPVFEPPELMLELPPPVLELPELPFETPELDPLPEHVAPAPTTVTFTFWMPNVETCESGALMQRSLRSPLMAPPMSSACSRMPWGGKYGVW